jgi:hypothetical protein
VLVAGHAHHAGEALHDLVERLDRAVGGPRIARCTKRVVEPDPRHDVRPEVLRHHVESFDEIEDDRPAARVFEVERDRRLARVHRDERRAQLASDHLRVGPSRRAR